MTTGARGGSGRAGSACRFDLTSPRLRGCDAVAICSETVHHPALRAAARGRAILCEKPTARRRGDAEHRRGRRAVGRALHAELPEAAGSGLDYRVNSSPPSLGRIQLVRIRHGHFYGLQPDFKHRWYVDAALSGGGALLDEGVHGADLLAWLFGMPEEVTAVVSSAALGLPVEDLGIATFTFPSGLVAELTASFSFAAADVSIELYGTGGTVLVSGVDLAPATSPTMATCDGFETISLSVAGKSCRLPRASSSGRFTSKTRRCSWIASRAERHHRSPSTMACAHFA